MKKDYFQSLCPKEAIVANPLFLLPFTPFQTMKEGTQSQKKNHPEILNMVSTRKPTEDGLL